MHPALLFGIPGALLLYMVLGKKAATDAAAVQSSSALPQGQHPSLPWSLPSGGTKVLTTDQSPSANAANYIQHLNNAQDALDTIHEKSGTDSAATLDAWNSLNQPMDTLTIQKDLNVLGATPALTEDGVMGPVTKTAIAHFQTQMQLPSTGVMDAATNNALKRAAVAVAYGS